MFGIFRWYFAADVKTTYKMVVVTTINVFLSYRQNYVHCTVEPPLKRATFLHFWRPKLLDRGNTGIRLTKEYLGLESSQKIVRACS